MARSALSAKPPAHAIPASSGWVAAAAIPLLFFLWPDTSWPDILTPDTLLPDRTALSARDSCNLYILALFLSLALHELLFLKIHNSPGTGLRFDRRNFTDPTCWQSYVVKLVGLAASLGGLAVVYWAVELYRGDWYAPFFATLSDHGGLILAVIVTNVTLAHFAMLRPRDGLWHIGALLLTLGRGDTDREQITGHLLALTIKGFFIPLMYCYLVYDWEYLRGVDLTTLTDFPAIYAFLYRFLFFADLSLVVVGYVFAARVLNSHIRWSEPTMLGWVVCILCYAPFWQLFSRSYFDYFSPSYTWGNWLWDYPVAYGIWGTTILILMAIYTMGTMRMGLRFSNLTYRGVAYGFPFNLSRHPQYISKNITWWLIDIPFVATDLATGFSNCASLLGVNLIYLLRARCEERCLRRSPSYRHYERQIARHGLLARLRGGQRRGQHEGQDKGQGGAPMQEAPRRRPDPRAK
ncbi:hypothetical protein [Aliiroseovarius crassostreae]|uniref:hypothetical protein n=1 Tax=Aliiroseovarius crassostreae TaxID=154981 RepID=UPI0021FA3FDD|nr:hypothetical protein [Aliiroseovarius crassostreae]UWP97771.1 hypothetical protein K3X53_10320 [Aliiroseovarius crassostreae]